MPPFPDDLLVGHPEIDADHRELYDHVEQFREAMFGGSPDAVFMRGFLQYLTAFLVEHFRHEDGLMEAAAYARRAEHKIAHRTLWHDLLAVTDSCEEREYDPVCVVRVSTLILTWLDAHVEDHDRPLADFLRGRSVVVR